MPIISIVFLIILMFFFFSGFRKNAVFFSPGRVFAILWCVVLGLIEFKFSRLQIQWNTFDWLMVLLPLLTFLTGVYISFLINLNKSTKSIQEVKNNLRSVNFSESNLYSFIIFYFFLCFISFLIEWQIEGYLPLFTSKPERARVIFGVFGLHHILNSINAVLFLIVQYFIFVKGRYVKKITLAVVFILSLGNYILFVQRFGFFVFLMMALALYYYAGEKIRLRTYIIFILVLVGLVVGVQTLRTPELLKAAIIYNSQMKFSADYAEFVIPYMYIVMNVENYVKYYPSIDQHSFGFFTFDFLSELTTIRKTLAEYYDFYKTKNYIAGYNTYPFYWPYYYDFGIIGISIIPFLIGFFFSEIYYLMRRNPNLIVLSLNCIAFAIIMISYNSDPLTRLDTLLSFFVIIVAQVFITAKKFNKVNLNS
jgi:oligosaccharide repeat unit polymerase